MARARRSTTTGRFTKAGVRSASRGGSRRGRTRAKAARGRRTATGWLRAGGG